MSDLNRIPFPQGMYQGFNMNQGQSRIPEEAFNNSIYRDSNIQPQINRNNALLSQMPDPRVRAAQNMTGGQTLTYPESTPTAPPTAPATSPATSPMLGTTPPSSSLSAPPGSLLAQQPSPPQGSVLAQPQAPQGEQSVLGQPQSPSAVDGMSPDAVDYAKSFGLGTIGDNQTAPPVTPQQAQLKFSSGNEQDIADGVSKEEYHPFITPNDPIFSSVFKQTDQYKMMDGTDGGTLPISEDNGSVYNCPFTKTPCSRPSFFRRIGAFIKKMFGVYDDNQALGICQVENLKDPIARQVLISTGQFDQEAKQQLMEQTQSQGMASTVSSMPGNSFAPPQSQLQFGNSVHQSPYQPRG